MTTIKTFSLCIALLSSFSLLPMEHDFMNHMEHMDIGANKIDTSHNSSVRKIWERIDSEFVGVSNSIIKDYSFMRPFVGMFLSYRKGRQIKSKQAQQELEKIESWIKSCITIEKHQLSTFELLVANHWYVGYLTKAVANGNIEDVTGFTIDDVYNKYEKVDSDSISGAVFCDEYKKFFENNLSKKKLTDIVPAVVSDVHFTVLCNPRGNIKPHSLKMCSNGKYLKATGEDNVSVAWDMETGKIVDIHEITADRWIPGKTEAQEAVLGVYSCAQMDRYRVIDVHDNYCARISDSHVSIDSEFFPKKYQNNSKAIILFKRPQIQSYLCQKAFDNSYMNGKELETLRNSNTCKAMQGFARENLERLIDGHIKQVAFCDRILG